MISGLISRVRSFWRAMVHQRVLETEMAEEFRLHQELRAEQLRAEGMSPDDATRQARLEFGSSERYREEARESRGLRYVDQLVYDLRYTVRSLRRSPGFTMAAALMLALGIGANAAVFSLVSASLLRPLPFPDASRLVVLHQTEHSAGGQVRTVPWSYPEFEAVRPALTSLASVATYHADNANLSREGATPLRVRIESVSAAYLTTLGVHPVMGRGFLATEDEYPVERAAAILAHDTWSRVFGADSGIVGEQIRLNGVSITVAGVAPPGFRGLTGEAELWIPNALTPEVSFSGHLTSTEHFHEVVGRLAPGTSLERVRAEVSTIAAREAAAVRETAGLSDDATWGADARTLDHARRDPAVIRAQLVLAGAALFVLLIALVNVSGLLLARSTLRARETSVRAALGAGRARLVWHGITEGTVLGAMGGVAGMLLASWGVRAVAALAPGQPGGTASMNIHSFAEPVVDWRVITFATVMAIAAGFLLGLVTSLRATRGDLQRAPKTGARGSTVGVGSLSRPTVLSAAVIVQVACGIVLLGGAVQLLTDFRMLASVDRGFDPDNVLTFRISPPESEYVGDRAAPLLERILASVEALPGVQSATVSGCTPFNRCSSTWLYIDGAPADQPPVVGRHYVGPDHFRTLGIPLVQGRGLTTADRAGQPRVAVINETAAQRFWPGQNPIGRRVWFGSGGGFAHPDSLTEIVGIVADVLYATPGGEVRPDFYTSYMQFTWPHTTVMVRTSGAPLALVPALREAVRQVDANLPIHDVLTMRQRGAAALAGERFATAVLTTFAALGLLLASLGVYGIMAYSVAHRRREMGIRLALGSTASRILRLVIGQGMVLTAAGIVVGTLASMALAGLLPALVATGERGGASWVAPAVAVLVLAAVAALACYIPARSAMRVSAVESIASD